MNLFKLWISAYGFLIGEVLDDVDVSFELVDAKFLIAETAEVTIEPPRAPALSH